jgi:hypothetical protein
MLIIPSILRENPLMLFTHLMMNLFNRRLVTQVTTHLKSAVHMNNLDLICILNMQSLKSKEHIVYTKPSKESQNKYNKNKEK